MKIHVDLDLCQGHARCESICPEVFGTDDREGKCVIRAVDVPPRHRERTRLAVQNCPENALSTTED